MKKRIVALFLAATLAASLMTACGSTASETEAEPVEEAVVEEAAVEEVEETVEEEPVEEEPEEFVLTEEYAMEKLNKAFEAGDNLAANGDDLAKYLYDNELDIILLNKNMLDDYPDLVTGDNISLDRAYLYQITTSAYIRYLDSYINGDGSFTTNFEDYITNNNFDDIMVADEADGAWSNTNDTLLVNIASDLKYIKDMNLSISDIAESDISIFGIDGNKISAKYQCNLVKDGNKTDALMIFDENGNFLSIIDVEVLED